MSNSTALVGSALVGQARVGSLGATPPAYLRAGGGCWKLIHDPAIGDIAGTLEGWTNEGGLIDQIREDLDGQVDWWYQGTEPVTAKPGDYWIPADGPMQVLTPDGWEDVSDPRIEEALEAAGTAQATADGKITTYGGATAPAGTTQKPLGEGDLWVRDGDARLHVYRSGSWVAVDQAAIDAAEEAAKDYADTQDQTVLNQAATAAQDKADAAQAEAVRLAELAATEADEALEAALGDLVADKSNVFIQDVAPVAEMQKPGVLWIDTTPVAVDGTQVPGNVPKTWSGAAWVAITDSAALEAARAAAAAHEAAEAAADAAGQAMAEARYAPRIADRMPTPTDGEGKPAGAGWWQYDPTSQLLVQGWRWTGAVWERLDMDPVMIPVLDIGTGTVGDLTGDRVTVTGTLSANIVNAMDANTKKLVVTEEAILNHATLIGDTVVDNINVTGKLIGTDGVFTGTVDFENVNVTGLQLVEKLEANSISADLIEGGAFTGESFTGGTFVGGEFRTSDTLPGQVTLSDTANAGTPGLSVEPEDPTGYDVLPSIGPGPADMRISGGVSTDGTMSGANFNASGTHIYHNGPGANGAGAWSTVNSSGVEMRYRTNRSQSTPQTLIRAEDGSAEVVADGGGGTFSVIGAGFGYARVVTERPGGRSTVYTNTVLAELEYRTGTFSRKLTVDATGVWAQSGADTVSLIPQVRPFQYSAQWNADLSPSPIMVQHLPGGKICQAQIRIQNLTGSSLSLPNATWVTLNYNPIPADLRGGFTDYIEVTLPQNEARGRVEMNYSTGSIRIRNISGTTISWEPNNSIWFSMRWFSPN